MTLFGYVLFLCNKLSVIAMAINYIFYTTKNKYRHQNHSSTIPNVILYILSVSGFYFSLWLFFHIHYYYYVHLCAFWIIYNKNYFKPALWTKKKKIITNNIVIAPVFCILIEIIALLLFDAFFFTCKYVYSIFVQKVLTHTHTNTLRSFFFSKVTLVCIPPCTHEFARCSVTKRQFVGFANFFSCCWKMPF